MTGSPNEQVAHLWRGSGGNGKGVMKSLISRFHKKSAAVNLEEIGKDFGYMQLLDASLALVDETPSTFSPERLKSLVSGDPLPLNRKYRDPIPDFRCDARWIINSNQNFGFRSVDTSPGFFRRFIIIDWTAKPEQDGKIAGLDKLIFKQEPEMVAAISGGNVHRCSEFYDRTSQMAAPSREEVDIMTYLMSVVVSGDAIGLSIDADTLAGHLAGWLSGDSTVKKRINDLLGLYHARFLTVDHEVWLAVAYSLVSGGRTEFDSAFSPLLAETSWRYSYQRELAILLPEFRRLDPRFSKRRVSFGGVQYYCVLASMEPFRPPPRLRAPEDFLDAEQFSELEAFFS